jgi:hypothetical protein
MWKPEKHQKTVELIKTAKQLEFSTNRQHDHHRHV